MADRWWQRAVAYQIYPRSFCDSNGDGIGDLNGIISKLDYLKDLGVDVIWLCPINKSPMDDNGYDISDYYTIDPSFGTNKDMDKLLREAKKRNIKIVMDLVVNHCSDEHEWFQKALKDPEGEYAKYFYIKKGEGDNPPNNWRSIFGGSAWEKIADSDYYYLHIFTKKQVDLNWENPSLRSEIYDIMNYWLKKGIAGFRLDAITYIKKEDGLPSFPADADDGMVSVKYGSLNRLGIKQFLDEMKEMTYGKYDALTVGEVAGAKGNNMLPFISLKDGYFSMIFDFSYSQLNTLEPNHFWCYPQQWDSNDLKRILYDTHTSIQPEGWLATCLECHDSTRAIDHFLPPEGKNFYGASMLAVMYLCLRGTPFIYQGQEIGMRNYGFNTIEEYDDCSSVNQYHFALQEGFTPEEALSFVQANSRDNTRHPFAWNASKNAGFTNGTPWLPVSPMYTKINAEAQMRDDLSLLAFYKKLIALRKSNDYADILSTGEFEPFLKDYSHVVAYERRNEYNKISVICNYQNCGIKIELNQKHDKVLINNYEYLEVTEGTMILQPFQAVVINWC